MLQKIFVEVFFKDSSYLRSIKKREFKLAFEYLTMWLSYLLYLKRKGPIRTNLTCFTFVLTNFTGGGYKLNIFKFEKLHVVLRLSLIYIPLSKYFYEERKVKKNQNL